MKFVYLDSDYKLFVTERKKKNSYNFDFEKNMNYWTTENARGRIQSDGSDCGVFSCMYAESMK